MFPQSKQKQRQIRKKTTTNENENENDDQNINISAPPPQPQQTSDNKNIVENTNNNDNNNDDNDDNQVYIKPIIQRKVTSTSKKQGSNVFSSKRVTSSSSTGKSISTPPNLLSFEEENDGGSSFESSSGIKHNPLSSTMKKDDDDQLISTSTKLLRNESMTSYSLEALEELKKSTQSKPQIQKSIIDRDRDRMDIDYQQYNLDDNQQQDEKNVSSVFIPSNEQIKNAKEKRQRARDGKWQDDNNNNDKISRNDNFISLNTGDEDDDEVNSRLVREEDDDEEDQEDQTISDKSKTIKFGDPGKKSNTTTTSGAKKQQQQDTDEEEEEEDEETMRWRLEQIKKGGGMKDVTASLDFQKKKHHQSLLLEAPKPFYKSSSGLVTPSNNNNNNNDIITHSNPSFIDSLIKDLNGILVSLSEVEFNHKAEYDKVDEALNDSKSFISTMEMNQQLNQDQYVDYDELNTYANNMVDCLGEKVPSLEQLEERYLDLEKDLAHDLRKQTLDEINDEINDIDKQKESSNTSATATTEDVDEFGRDRSHYINASRNKRLELSRKKRKEKRNNNNRDYSIEPEGMSSDEETLFDIEEQEYILDQQQKVLESARSLLIDVDPDYSEISNIKDKFEHWKSKDLKSYTQTQMAYIMPSIFAPFIRLEMLDWNPLKGLNFDSMKWYIELSNYGINNNNNNNNHDHNMTDENDPDHNLIPKLVEKIVIPRIETYITYIWNPLSRKQSNNLFNIVQEVIIYLDIGDNSVKSLLSQILYSLQQSESNLTIPLFLNQNNSSDQEIFSNRMLCRCIKALRLSTLWIGLVSNQALLDLCFKDIVNNKILPFLSIKATANPQQTLFYTTMMCDAMKNLYQLKPSDKLKETLSIYLNQLAHVIGPTFPRDSFKRFFI